MSDNTRDLAALIKLSQALYSFLQTKRSVPGATRRPQFVSVNYMTWIGNSMAQATGRNWGERYRGTSPVFTRELILERLHELQHKTEEILAAYEEVNDTNEYFAQVSDLKEILSDINDQIHLMQYRERSASTSFQGNEYKGSDTNLGFESNPMRTSHSSTDRSSFLYTRKFPRSRTRTRTRSRTRSRRGGKKSRKRKTRQRCSKK